MRRALPSLVVRVLPVHVRRGREREIAAALRSAVATGRRRGRLAAAWTSPSSPIAAVAIVLAAITLAAAWMPARRAAQLDPLAVLRAE